MKRFSMLLLICLIFTTGCSVVQMKVSDISKLSSNILNKKLNLYNQISSGYKYYLPRGMSLIDDSSYNEKMISEGNTYYLYVDIVSYYFKKDLNYDNTKNKYYFKKLNFNNKKGYIQITKDKEFYLLKMIYNYGKIETLVSKKDIGKAFINASYILNSLTFNNRIINTLFNDDTSSFSEEKFKLFESKSETSQFLEYIKEYDKYKEEIDEDLIKPNTTTTNNENNNTANDPIQ